VESATKTAPFAFCDVIGWPPSNVPAAPGGRISACFWMLPSIVLANRCALARARPLFTRTPPSQFTLVSAFNCSTGLPVDTAVASAVVPTWPFSPETSGAATSNPDPVRPSVPRSVMCGAR
jgi:hypothetical protein